MTVESGGNPRAVSSAGAMGLMQIMPATWTELSARYDLGNNPYNSRPNILAGAAYLREMYDRYGSVAAMLAAYNAGPARLDEHLAKGRILPAETRSYVARLTRILGGMSASEMPVRTPVLVSDWRAASLFVAHQNDSPATAPFLSDLQSGGLFVERSARGGSK
ncbi:lytic transglycosylase domain-containing protein [Brucellaceae bacterium D45D]